MVGRSERLGGSSAELRVLTADEWQSWRQLRLEALTEAAYAFGSKLAHWAAAPEEQWRARLDLVGSHNLVAFVGGTPVGMATGVPGDRPREAGLISMYVSSSARGQGVGSLLLEAVEDWAVSRGAEILRLHVVAENHPARRLYERHGLVVTGEVDREAPEDPLELEMCKRLAD